MILLVPIVGVGSEEDPYRAAVADLGIDYRAYIPSDELGAPKNTQAMVEIADEDFARIPDWMTTSVVPQSAQAVTEQALDQGLL